jgi:hypothetical protein
MLLKERQKGQEEEEESYWMKFRKKRQDTEI